MKKSLKIYITLLAVIFASSVEAQKFQELQKSPTDIASAKKSWGDKPTIRVIYSRPQKNDREVFGELVKYGKLWRTGADENTEIEFFKDYKLGDKLIKAGRYSLFTIPGEKEWTIILNSDLDNWGHFSYNEGNDVARIKVPSRKSESTIEAFGIVFKATDNGYNMYLGWDDTVVEVPFYD